MYLVFWYLVCNWSRDLNKTYDGLLNKWPSINNGNLNFWPKCFLNMPFYSSSPVLSDSVLIWDLKRQTYIFLRFKIRFRIKYNNLHGAVTIKNGKLQNHPIRAVIRWCGFYSECCVITCPKVVIVFWNRLFQIIFYNNHGSTCNTISKSSSKAKTRWKKLSLSKMAMSKTLILFLQNLLTFYLKYFSFEVY